MTPLQPPSLIGAELSRIGFAPSRLTLGTVQLGLPYGIANATGQPTPEVVAGILDTAIEGGITTFDTARAYGTSESAIGAYFAGRTAAYALRTKIVTKLAPLSRVPTAERAAAAVRSLAASMRELGRDRLDVVLVHRESDLIDDSVYDVLQAAKSNGRIGGFGASVYAVEAAEMLQERGRLDAVQVPLSIADRRFARFAEHAAAAGVTVFARSVFLQGALLLNSTALPRHLAPLAAPLEKLAALTRVSGLSPATLALAAARDTAGIASLVVGVERADQLPPHLAAICAAPLHTETLAEALAAFAGLPPAILDPSQWPPHRHGA